jgi:hypothetical protein
MRRAHWHTLALAVCTAAWLVGCGGSGSSTPAADFSITVSPASLATAEGGTTAAATVTIAALNGFTGSVSVSIAGLPPGATAKPGFPVLIGPGAKQQFSVVTTDSTPTGTATLILHATSGALAHDASIDLVTGPVVQTSQQGTVLYLQSHANGHTVRIGLDTAWGGAIVEVSMDGTNFVNRHDTGREVQPALYDGADQYPDPGPGSSYGWDPVLAGDAYGAGSQVLHQAVAAESLFTSTAPLQWWPDNFGGGSGMPVAADTTFEQTITVAAGAPLAFKVHFKLIHNGTDTHYNSGQELPAVYVNSIYTTLAYYGGSSPWANGALTRTVTQTFLTGSFATAHYAPEQWAALVDGGNQGLAVYVPGQYPYDAAWSFAGQTGTGPFGNTTVYMLPTCYLTILPGTSFEGDVYLVPGDLSAARAAIYAVHAALSATDICAPLTSIDQPVGNATIGGSVTVTGWSFDNVALSGVSVYVDGAPAGTATLGISRPDVAAAYPHVAPANAGWRYTLDTTKIANGPHTLTVHAGDSAGNAAVNAPISVIVSN